MDFDMSKMQGMLAQAQQMQEQMDQKLAETTVEGTSGGGMVTVRMTGKKSVAQHPHCAHCARFYAAGS